MAAVAEACNVPVEAQQLFPLSRRQQRYSFRSAIERDSMDDLEKQTNYLVDVSVVALTIAHVHVAHLP